MNPKGVFFIPTSKKAGPNPVSHHYINWDDFREVKAMIERADDVSEMEEVEKKQQACSHPEGIDPEDGCVECGFYAK